MKNATMYLFRAFPLVLAFVLASALFLPNPATAARFEIEPGPGTIIVFQSSAPMETFHGRTGRVWGWIEADLEDLSGEVELEVEVDLASFDTGKKKRNQHMRENHFQTDQYPRASFRAGRIVRSTAVALSPGSTATLVLSGEFDLHGVVRPMQCEVHLALGPTGDLEIRTSFPVKLSDHEIDRPRFLVMKLADEQMVDVTIKAVEKP